MKKLFFVLMLCMVFLSGIASANVTDAPTASGVSQPEESVGETLDHAGRSLVYGLGALLVAPFRLLQDIFNGVSQGAAHEKFCDHTN